MKATTRIGLALGLTLALLAGLAPRAEAADRYWIATSTANWNDTANWSTTASGAGGASVPGSSDIAYFGADTSKDGNCSVNAAANVAGINIAAGYDGTISQGGVTITVGSTGWTQAGGTFTGSSSAIALNGAFSLSGGTFTGTSGTMTMKGNWTHTAGTFSHNNGTVTFDGSGVSYSISVPSTETFYNLTATCVASVTLNLNGNTLVVLGTFTDNAGANFSNPVILNNGTIEARGNVVASSVNSLDWRQYSGGTATLIMKGTADQSLTSSLGHLCNLAVDKPSGTVTCSGELIIGSFTLTSGTFTSTSGKMWVKGNWSHTAGTFNHNNGTVEFYCRLRGAQPYSVSVPSPETFYNLSVSSYENLALNLNGNTLVVLGTFANNGGVNGSNPDKFDNGTLELRGNIAMGTYTDRGTAAVTLTGSGNQTYTTSGGVPPGGTWTINKSGGSLTLASALSLSAAGQQLVWTSGSLNLSTYTLTVAGTISTGAGAEGLELATGGVLTSPAAYALTCRSLKLGSDTFAYGTYNVLNSYTSIENNTVNFSTFFTGAGTKTILVNPRPTVSIGATTPDAYEQPSPLAGMFTVNRGSRTDGDLIVNFTLASGGANATPGAANDYTLSGTGVTWVDGATSGSVTIPNGATSATITATPVDDVSYDPDETVIPTLTANANYTVGSPASATVTIHDNETGNVAPVVSAGANQTVLSNSLPIVATLNGSVTDDGQPTPVNLTKTWSQVSVDPPGGTASFTDTTDPGTTVSFDQEGVYVLNLRGDDGALQTDSQVTISVYKRQVSVAVQDGTARATQSPTDTAAFRVSRPVTCTNEDLVVNYTLGGTATVGTDYSILPLSGSVIIPQGATYGDIVVTPVWKQDSAKTVVLTLTAGPVQAPYEITGQNPPSACTLAKVTGPDRYWVAASEGNWNTTANWSDESGGAGGFSVPGSGSVAIFDGGGAGNCAINAAVDVAGINIGSGYGGAISQSAVTITVGSTGWTQAGGTFTGSSSAIALNGPFSLSGGTFTGTSGTMTMKGNWTHTAGTFSHNNGTVAFYRQYRGSPVIISVPTTETFNNLSVSSYEDLALDLNGNTLVVLGTFANNGGVNQYNPDKFDNGTLELRGNIAMGTYTATGTAAVKLTGSGNQTYTTSGGVPPGGTWTIDKSGGAFSLLSDLGLTAGGQQLVWTNGAADLSSNTLTVAGATTIYPGATTLGVTVADATKAGRLTCGSTVGNIANVGLEVTVTAAKEQAPQFQGQTYTILSNTGVLAAPFESVSWVGFFEGDVSYAENDGKNVTISGLRYPPGTVFRFK